MVGEIEWAARETIRQLNETLSFNVEYIDEHLYNVHLTDTVGPGSFIVEIRYSPNATCSVSTAFAIQPERITLFMEIFVKMLNA